jgi:hypothetical protein
MKASVAIARDKSTAPSEAPYLDRVERALAELEEASSTLPERIRANKMARGAEQVKLTRSEQALLASLEQDRTDGESQLMQQFRELDSTQEVIWALAFGLESDLETEHMMLKHCPPEELFLFQELSQAKRSALEAMQAYLAAFPAES